MDKISHIVFAAGLLKMANERTDMAYLSILPLIDVEPSFLHRLHCHPIVRIPRLVEAAKIVFGSTNGDFKEVDKHSYTYEINRLEEVRTEVTGAFKKAIVKSGNESMLVDNGYGAILSTLSHTYFDTFNNAVQAFAPYENYCAGQYDMWKQIDDYFSYRIKWYRQTAPQVCKEVMLKDFWNQSYTAKDLILGMIARLAALTEPSIDDEIVQKVAAELGVDSIVHNKFVDQFYVDMEEAIKESIVNSVNTLDTVPSLIT